MRRRILWIPLVAVTLVAAALWWRGGSGEAAIAPSTFAVQRGDVTVNVLASGQIESSELVSVGAQVSGTIETLAVDLGQTVAKGDLIAQIESTDQQNDVKIAEASLSEIEAQIAAKQANLTLAETTFARQTRLRDLGTATGETFDEAEANLAVLRAELAQLQAQRASAEISVATAQTALDRTRISAPMDGTVVAIVNKQGQTVNANQTTPTIVKLADLKNMVVKAEISEADVVRVASGQDVTFSILGDPQRQFAASVRAIEPAPSGIVDSDTISTEEAIYYNGLFDVENPDGLLRIGMTAEVSIALSAASDVLTLPAAALGRPDDDGSYTVHLYRAGSETGEPRKIRIGLNNNVTAEVTEGLEEGDRILASTEGLPNATRQMRARGGPMGF